MYHFIPWNIKLPAHLSITSIIATIYSHLLFKSLDSSALLGAFTKINAIQFCILMPNSVSNNIYFCSLATSFLPIWLFLTSSYINCGSIHWYYIKKCCIVISALNIVHGWKSSATLLTSWNCSIYPLMNMCLLYCILLI